MSAARAATAPARAERGFTLIELLVVMAVLGLMAVAVPMMVGRGAPGLEARQAAREVAAVLRRARGDAILDNRTVSVAFDTAEPRYAIDGGAWHALPSRIELSVETAASEVTAPDIAGVRLFADGSASGGRITVRRGDRQYHVMLDWLTGQVRVVD